MFANYSVARARSPGFIMLFQFGSPKGLLTQSLFKTVTERKKVSIAVTCTKPHGNFHLE